MQQWKRARAAAILYGQAIRREGLQRARGDPIGGRSRASDPIRAAGVGGVGGVGGRRGRRRAIIAAEIATNAQGSKWDLKSFYRFQWL
jgi:hypothetical protein